MFRNAKRLLPLLLAAILLIMAPVAAAQDILIVEPEPTVDPTDPSAYMTAVADIGSMELALDTSAAPYYPFTSDISCELSGAAFQKFTVAKGDTVKAGDVLAYIYIPCSTTDIARMELNLQRAEEEMTEGIRQRQEAIAALQTQAAAETNSYEKEILELTIEYQKAELEQYRYLQQRSLDSRKEALAQYDPIPVIAPHDGTVTRLSRLDADETLRYGDTLLTLQDESVLLLKLGSANNLFAYNLPATVNITVRGKDGAEDVDYTLTGRVVAANNLVPEGVPYNKGIYIQLDPGQTVPEFSKATVIMQNRRLSNVLTVPETAIHMDKDGRNYVEVLHADGQIEKRYVEQGPNGSFYDYFSVSGVVRSFWITNGLSEGETVIIRS